ncbi:MAG: hypothetical protein FWB98_06760 [Defluviitaleaceae bacterium]|nr:hypothetical protein [Defluviitaleaceae bacterium]
MSPGFSAVIADHLEENIPMIMEGDFILPDFAAYVASERVEAVFIHEPCKNQIMQNYPHREVEGLQEYRAEISHLHGNMLVDKCAKYGIAATPSRPWDDLLERVKEYLQR